MLMCMCFIFALPLACCRRFDAQDFCGVLLGLYRMRYHPGQRWLDAYAQAVALKVQLLPPQQHALIVAVLRAMGYSCRGRPFAWVMDEAAVAAMCDREGSRGGSNSSSSRPQGSSSSSSNSRDSSGRADAAVQSASADL
jgi:hypothetical protein